MSSSVTADLLAGGKIVTDSEVGKNSVGVPR